MTYRIFPQTTLLLLILMALVIPGCSIKTEGLVPDRPVATTRKIDKSVKVTPTEGGHASKFGREAYITNEQYHDALYRTLTDAQLFSRVVESGDADWELHSEIITITTEAGISPTYAI
jgi:hypothetical protein